MAQCDVSSSCGAASRVQCVGSERTVGGESGRGGMYISYTDPSHNQEAPRSGEWGLGAAGDRGGVRFNRDYGGWRWVEKTGRRLRDTFTIMIEEAERKLEEARMSSGADAPQRVALSYNVGRRIRGPPEEIGPTGFRTGQSKYNLLVKAGKGLTEWLPRNNDELESYTGISLTHNKNNNLLNYELHLPHLDTFLIYGNNVLPMFSNEFVKGMKEGHKSLRDSLILGKMKELEILIIRDTCIKEIPQEIDQFVNLRKLDATNCKKLSNVVPGVISKLWRLEKLCIIFMSVEVVSTSLS
ncbi:NB-ARC domains-containing protein [Tanacetum coccineum]